MRVADPAGPWQLELHMPENHIGHVAKEQQAIYDKLRTKLKELLGEEAWPRPRICPPRTSIRRWRPTWPKCRTRTCG